MLSPDRGHPGGIRWNTPSRYEPSASPPRRHVVVLAEQIPRAVALLDALEPAVLLLPVDNAGEVSDGAGLLAGLEVHALTVLTESAPVRSYSRLL